MSSRFFSIINLTILSFICQPLLWAQTAPNRELRAAWIASVANIDWPSQKGLSARQQQEEYVKLLDTLKAVGMNAVVVQVRPSADAFYPSSYEPWSEYLSGEQGQSPEPYYNPLAFMIQQAKQHALEFHAWFNPYRAGTRDSMVFASTHPFHQHPEWFLKYGGRWYYDPGHPEAQEYVLQSILETVKHYDLDAVHFDDYFYPYRIANEAFPDSSSYLIYGKEKFGSVDDWRRSNVDYFVEELSSRIKAEKPHIKFGISPFGVWRNKDKDPDGSDTQAGQTNYDDLYADVLKWLKQGWIDYVTPQLYWHIGFEVADYTVLLDWWSKHSYGKHLYIGQAVYRIGGKGWENPEELFNQVLLNRKYHQVNGSMYFSAKSFLQNKQDVNQKMQKIYPSKALIPPMSWIDSVAPLAPVIQYVSGTQGNGVQLSWNDSTQADTHYYVIYRFGTGDSVSTEQPQNRIAVVQRKPYAVQTWLDKKTEKRTRYTYGVTAVDRGHNESPMSKPIAIKTKGKRRVVKMASQLPQQDY